MKIQLTARRPAGSSAWSKAPADAAQIASRLGFGEIDVDFFRISRASLTGRILNKLKLLHIVDSFLFYMVYYCLAFRFQKSGGGELFIQHPGYVFSTEHLMEKIWGYDTDSSIDVVWTHIGFVRKKLRSIGADVEIKTIRGAGYSLEVAAC